MSHARIEEVSDSDAEISDPSEGDIDEFKESDVLMRRSTAAATTENLATTYPTPGANAAAHILNPRTSGFQPPSTQPVQFQSLQTSASENSAHAHYLHIYPIYFDASRSRGEGRRVPKALAVKDPVAKEIVSACTRLRMSTRFEIAKVHPNDWANPGRVRVDLRASPLYTPAKPTAGRASATDKGTASLAASSQIHNKHHLLILIARHLRDHPTTENAPALRFNIPGIPLPPTHDEHGKPLAWPRPAVPRGWKIGGLLPHYSPAISTGGMSESLLKEMIREGLSGAGPGGVGGMLPPGMEGMAEMLQGLDMGGGAGGSTGGRAGSSAAVPAKEAKKKGKKK